MAVESVILWENSDLFVDVVVVVAVFACFVLIFLFVCFLRSILQHTSAGEQQCNSSVYNSSLRVGGKLKPS